MGSLLDWFKTRREVTIIKETREHAKKVYDCTNELNELIILILKKGKLQEIEGKIRRINDIEHECDDIRRKVMLDLTKGELVPSVREDLAHLIKRLDAIANNANAAAKRLGILDLEIFSPISEELKKMSETSLKCIGILHKTIDSQLGHPVSEIYDSINEINRLEHEIDVLNFEIKRKLANIRPDYSPYKAMLLFKVIDLLESISDFAEETGDFIKIINVRQES